MIAILQAIYQVLVGDATLAGLLSSYRGSPAVFTEHAPKDAQMPYLVMRCERSPGDDQASDRTVWIADVYDRSSSSQQVHQIMERVEKLLNLEGPALSSITNLGMFRGYAGMVPEDEPGVQHGHMEFTLRHGREDLFA